MGNPIQGFEGNPSTPNTTAGEYPAWWWDNGFPPAAIAAESNLPVINAGLRNGKSAVGVAKDGINLPRYQNWSVSWERQLSPNTLLEVAYVANRGTRLINSWTKAGYPFANTGAPGVLTTYTPTQLGTQITNAAIQTLPVVLAMPVDPADGLHKPYAAYGTCPGAAPACLPAFSGTLAQALRPFPQFQSINWRNAGSRTACRSA
jgi:hypothetical protein